MSQDVQTFQTIPSALAILDKLGVEIKTAPSFRRLDAISAAAEAIQKRFRPVQEVADKAGEIWTEAEIRLREELDKLEKPRRGVAGPGRGKKKPDAETALGFSRGGPSLKELGIAPKRASRAKQLQGIPTKLRQRYVKELKDEGGGVNPNAILRKHHDAEREKKREGYRAQEYKGNAAANLTGLIESGEKFGVLYVDPPWTYATYSDKGKDRSPDYETMSLKSLMALPVGELAADDCALLLWAVMPSLPDAFELIKAWGFAYSTVAFVWVKQNKSDAMPSVGMGYFTRSNAELCLLATKGSPTRLANDVSQVILAPRGQHSEKPEEARKRIERLLPGPRIELFARKSDVEGWSTWGSEV